MVRRQIAHGVLLPHGVLLLQGVRLLQGVLLLQGMEASDPRCIPMGVQAGAVG